MKPYDNKTKKRVKMNENWRKRHQRKKDQLMKTLELCRKQIECEEGREQFGEERKEHGQEREEHGQEREEHGQEREEHGQEREECEQDREQSAPERARSKDSAQYEKDNEEYKEDSKDSNQSEWENEQIYKDSEESEYNLRLQTFENWPVDHLLTPAVLAEAGLAWIGVGDKVACAVCSTMWSWADCVLEEGDDPWVDHATKYPPCEFVRKKKGSAFIAKNQVTDVGTNGKPLKIRTLLKYCSIAGIRFDYGKLVEDCVTYKDRTDKLLALLHETGIEGEINMEKVMAIRKKRKPEKDEMRRQKMERYKQKREEKRQETKQREQRKEQSSRGKEQVEQEEEVTRQETEQIVKKKEEYRQKKVQREVENEQSTQEKEQCGQEREQLRQERKQREQEMEPIRQGTERNGQEREGCGQESQQSRQDREQRGQDRDERGQESQQSRQDREHCRQDREERGQESQQSRQDREQRGQDREERGQEGQQSRQEREQRRQKTEQNRQETDQNGQERGQRGQYKDQREQDEEQRGQKRQQRGRRNSSIFQGKRSRSGSKSAGFGAQNDPILLHDIITIARNCSENIRGSVVNLIASLPHGSALQKRPANEVKTPAKKTKLSCEECGKIYTNKYFLEKHMSQHDTSCEECGEVFSNTRSLSKHRKTCGKSAVKKVRFDCAHCKKCYSSENFLVNHIKGEHDQTVSVCDKCGAYFSFISSLVEHQKTCGNDATQENTLGPQQWCSEKGGYTANVEARSSEDTVEQRVTQCIGQSSSKSCQNLCKLCFSEGPYDLQEHYIRVHKVPDPLSVLCNDRTFLVPTKNIGNDWFCTQLAKAMERYTDTVCRLCEKTERDLLSHCVEHHKVERELFFYIKRLFREDGVIVVN